jgi:hypothetical protein
MDILLEDSNFRTDIGSQPQYKIKNFILTRFNLKLPSFREKIAGDEEEYKNWLRNRQHIFLQHCLKSIARQVSKPYKWLLLFDKTNYFDIFEETLLQASQYDFILPVFVEENKNLHQTILEVVNSYISQDDDCVTMTRLDNDDALSILFLKTLNQYINSLDIQEYTEANPLWITFNYGVQFNGEIFNLFLQNNNAFLTTLIKVDKRELGFTKFKNYKIHPLSINHSSVFRLDKKVQIIMTRLPVWMQYVHDQNVLNKFRQTNFIIERSAYELLEKFFLISKPHS